MAPQIVAGGEDLQRPCYSITLSATHSQRRLSPRWDGEAGGLAQSPRHLAQEQLSATLLSGAQDLPSEKVLLRVSVLAVPPTTPHALGLFPVPRKQTCLVGSRFNGTSHRERSARAGCSKWF